jgi:thioredoxin-related protein
MKKLIFLLLIPLSILFAGSKEFAAEYGYTNDYQEAFKKSKETKKLIMLMISTASCPWCRKLEASTLKKEFVNAYIQEHYIPVSVIKDVDKYPKKFDAPVVPFIYFINSDEEVVGSLVGYKPADKFMEKLKDTSHSLKPIVRTSPYSLENLKSVRVKVFDKSKTLQKEEKKHLKAAIEKKLHAVGIDTAPQEFSSFVVKIESVELDKTTIFNVTLRVVEDVIPKRDNKLESLAITYYKNDLFEVEETPFTSVKESLFQYILPEFVKQYQEEN